MREVTHWYVRHDPLIYIPWLMFQVCSFTYMTRHYEWHVTHMNESCHTWECVMLRTRITHGLCVCAHIYITVVLHLPILALCVHKYVVRNTHVNITIAVCCSVLQCIAVCCSVWRCVAVCCGVLRFVAVCCNVLQCVAVCCSELQWVAVCYGVLQLVAVCFSMFQYVAMWCWI